MSADLDALRDRYEAIFEAVQPPFAFVDLDALTIRTAREPFCPDGLVVLAEYRRRVLSPPSGG